MAHIERRKYQHFILIFAILISVDLIMCPQPCLGKLKKFQTWKIIFVLKIHGKCWLFCNSCPSAIRRLHFLPMPHSVSCPSSLPQVLKLIFYLYKILWVIIICTNSGIRDGSACRHFFIKSKGPSSNTENWIPKGKRRGLLPRSFSLTSTCKWKHDKVHKRHSYAHINKNDFKIKIQKKSEITSFHI